MGAWKTSKYVSGEHWVWWCHACDCEMNIANSYEENNADVRPYCETSTEHRQYFMHIVHLQSMLSLLVRALKPGSVIINGCSTQQVSADLRSSASSRLVSMVCTEPYATKKRNGQQLPDKTCTQVTWVCLDTISTCHCN